MRSFTPRRRKQKRVTSPTPCDVEVSGSSTNVEEAACSSYCSKSNEQRCGSVTGSAPPLSLSMKMLAVTSNASTQWAATILASNDVDVASHLSLQRHSFLPTTDFLSCLSCSPFDRRLTGQLRPGHGTMIYVAGPRSFERALPALAHASERRRLLCAMNRLLRALLEAEPTRGP